MAVSNASFIILLYDINIDGKSSFDWEMTHFLNHSKSISDQAYQYLCMLSWLPTLQMTNNCCRFVVRCSKSFHEKYLHC